MGRQLLITLTIFICLNIVCAADSKLTKPIADPAQYEIIDGNCSIAFASDMIFHEHVHKSRLPLTTREATSSWHGDKKIYCLKVLNEKDESKGATVFVKEGGVGHTFVTVEMHSAKNHGLEFTVQLFAK